MAVKITLSTSLPTASVSGWYSLLYIGAWRIGGTKSVFCARWVSIWLTKTAGAQAVTGTQPDSAPQLPVNTAGRSPAAWICENIDSGVPMRLTPRTSSSGLPLTKTR